MTKIAYFASVLFVMLVGCNNKTCASDDTECQSECPDCVVDSGKTAKVTMNVTADGVPVACNVSVGGVTGKSEETLTVNAGDEVEVLVGDGNPTKDGFLTINFDGVRWARKVDPLTLQAGDDEVISVELNGYFSGTYECVMDTYILDETAPDKKGELYSSGDLISRHSIEVKKTEKVKVSDGDISIGPLDSTAKLVVVGRRLELIGGDQGQVILDSEIVGNEFSFTMLNPAGAVYDIFCPESD